MANNEKKKIIYLTGSRSEFELMRTVLLDLNQFKEIELSLFVTAMHLSEKHGHTVDDIKKTGLKIARELHIDEFSAALEGALSSSIGFGKCVISVAKALSEIKPDLLLVEGDRIEVLAATIAAVLLELPVAHICGGDVSGGIDDSIRHSITKLSHIHFPGTIKSYERIIKMGEEPWRVHMTGTPINCKIAAKEEVEHDLGFDLSEKPILVLQHPVTNQSSQSAFQMNQTLKAVLQFDKPVVIVYPNNDSGYESIIEEIEKLRPYKKIHIFKNLPGEIFAGLMKYSAVMVGNSSAAIVEAPFFSIPCVNVGTRQEGRERAGNVIDVPHDAEQIKNALIEALSERFRHKLQASKNPYYSKDVGEKIGRVLLNLDFNDVLLQKKMTY